MLAAAGRIADGVLLNWSTPRRIQEARSAVEQAAAAAGRQPPWIAAYVRVAFGGGARERLGAEMERYRRSGPWYAAALQSQAEAGLIGVAADSAAELGSGLQPYRDLLQVTVVRALPEDDSLDSWRAVAEAAAAQQ
jgi:alkanesulfonate monooxygenase SsuD/methylene tetrahydromethanopterin reductase-like flavin-dependent oxidoreductase (luciferase family)